MFDPIFSTRSAIHKGWTSYPIPRSEITRLRTTNVLKGFGNDDAILSACHDDVQGDGGAKGESVLDAVNDEG